jgi:cytoskeletal protein RodZ
VTEKIHHQPFDHLTLEDIGQLLREAREKEGLTKSDVAGRTKITLEQLNILEEGRSPKIASVYACGFMRTYGELVNLDHFPEIYQIYKKLTSENDEDYGKPLTSKYMQTDLLSDNPSNTGTIVIVVLVILVLGAAVLYFSPTLRDSVYNLLPEVAQQNLPRFESSEPAQDSAQASQAVTDQAPLQAEAPVEDPEPSPPQPETYHGRLTLRAEKNTWAQVVVDNAPMEHIILEPGQSQSFDGLNSVHLIVGDGLALKMEWDGQDRGYVGQEGPFEKFFTLTPPET